MKEIAQSFIDKECMIYTITSDFGSINGTIVEIVDDCILIENNDNLQAINLKYVTRIREWPRNKKGKKKEIVLD